MSLEDDMIDNVTEFYASLTPFYHLIYPDWEKSIELQASVEITALEISRDLTDVGRE